MSGYPNMNRFNNLFTNPNWVFSGNPNSSPNAQNTGYSNNPSANSNLIRNNYNPIGNPNSRNDNIGYSTPHAYHNYSPGTPPDIGPPPRTAAMRTSAEECKNPILLQSQRTSSTPHGCSNAEPFRHANFFPGQFQRPTVLEYLIYIFWTCKRSGLSTCEPGSNCHRKVELLRKLRPQCNSWPEFAEWATQLAACTCAYKDELGIDRGDYQSRRGTVSKRERWDQLAEVYAELIKPFGMSTRYGEFSNQARFAAQGNSARDVSIWEDESAAPNIMEILNMISWLGGIVQPEGAFEMLPPWKLVNHTSSAVTNPHKNTVLTAAAAAVMEACLQLHASTLCPQRVWSVIKSLPGGEYNLGPFLEVPFQFLPHSGHTVCTFDFCETISINATLVKQKHHCGDENSCKPTTSDMFSRKLLNKAGAEGMNTAWRLDGLSLVEKERFMAISHVWADGTGTGIGPAGTVNSCLWEFWVRRARELGCEGIWWDAVCIPSDRDARAKAINEMHLNYSNAYCTLVHDSYLCTIEWQDDNPGQAAFAIVMSAWFTRGWTALELARSKQVKVLFKAPYGGHGYVIKDLDRDILAYPGEPTSRYHQLATAAIMRLRAPVNTLNDLLISLQLRYTSWTRDRAIIAGLMADIPEVYETVSEFQQSVYRNIVKKLGRIHADNLLHGLPTMGGNFSWLPTSMLDMPIAQNTAGGEVCTVRSDGSVIGQWRVRALGLVRPIDGEDPMPYYRPLSTHPYLLTRIIYAQSSTEERKKYLLLIGAWGRALLVKAMKKKNQHPKGPDNILYAEFVGCVLADETSLERKVTICICDVSDNMVWEDAGDAKVWADTLAGSQYHNPVVVA